MTIATDIDHALADWIIAREWAINDREYLAEQIALDRRDYVEELVATILLNRSRERLGMDRISLNEMGEDVRKGWIRDAAAEIAKSDGIGDLRP